MRIARITQHYNAQHLQNNKADEHKITADEKENITHLYSKTKSRKPNPKKKKSKN